MTSVPPEPPEPPAGSQPPAPPQHPVPQQPPAPQPPAPQPPAPSQGGPVRFDPASVNPMDWGILAAGLLAMIFSSFDYYTGTAHAPLGISRSVSESAWNGFFGWFAALVALASAVVLAVDLFAAPRIQVARVRLVVLGGFALSLLCMVIAGFVTPGAESSKQISAEAGVPVDVEYARGAGFYLSLIMILAGGVLSFLRLRETGGKLPWQKGTS